jgi:Flp pilus assembly protein TadG
MRANVILRRALKNRRGSTLVEFAMIAPVMCLFLAGAFDMAHSLYLTTVLQGIVQKTARDGSLESGTENARRALLDGRVKAQAAALVNNAAVTIDRRFYRTFSLAAAAQAEHWSDTDNDKTCDHGEQYQDDNGNGIWDADGGDSGQGGAKDRVVYTVTVTYPRMLPIYKFIGIGNTQTITARTVLQNQPYSDQGSYSTVVKSGTCP